MLMRLVCVLIFVTSFPMLAEASPYNQSCKSRLRALGHSAMRARKACKCVEQSFRRNPDLTAQAIAELVEYRNQYQNTNPVGSVSTDSLNLMIEYEGTLIDRCLNQPAK